MKIVLLQLVNAAPLPRNVHVLRYFHVDEIRLVLVILALTNPVVRQIPLLNLRLEKATFNPLIKRRGHRLVRS